MDDEAYRQYELEQDNWLKAGRRDFVVSQLRAATRGRTGLEILDLGAGVGQNIPALLPFGSVDALEINEIGLKSLRTIGGIRDIIDQPIPARLSRAYDVIVATDVLEHLPDDRSAAAWIAQHLKQDGIFFSTVPAYQFLFSEHDVALHHFRRYTAANYAAIMEPHLKVKRCGYFNSILFPIAAISRLASRAKPHNQPKINSRKQSSVVPAPLDSVFRSILSLEIRMIEHRIGLPFGLSVYCLARRT